MNETLLFDGNFHMIKNMGSVGSYRNSDGTQLHSSDGVQTGALMGAINSLVQIQHRFRPSRIVFCFDAGRSLYRLGIRSTYKSNREQGAGPVDVYNLKPQFGLFKMFLSIVGIPWLWEPGVEGDDFLAVLALRSIEPTVIVTADHDLIQLVTPLVSVLKPSQGYSPETVFTPEVVRQKFKMDPAQLPEMWALTGDPGDGIEGLKGVGPVTATKYLQKWGTLDRVLAGESRCRGHESQILENYAMIRLDGTPAEFYVPGDLDGTFRPCYSDELRDFLMQLELNTLVRRLDQHTLWKSAHDTLNIG